MALKTLENVKEIGGYKVLVLDDLKERNPQLFDEQGYMDNKLFNEEYRPKYPVQIKYDKNSISFTLKSEPKGDGCQVDTLIHAALQILKGFNGSMACRENAIAITKLDEALMWLGKRTKDREKRGVEGTSQT